MSSPSALAAAAGGTCTDVEALITGCGSISGGGVDVSGSTVVSGGGSSGSAGGGGSASDGGGGDGGGGSGAGSGGGLIYDHDPCPAGEICRYQAPELGPPDDPDAPAAPDVPAAPTVTISDVANFVPSVGVDGMEPAGWAIAGLPTNFYADWEPQVESGTVIGQPASVRFTPVSFAWDYGDGSGLTTNTSGASWAALGLPEFSETETSHVYAAPGSYTIGFTVQFGAEYRFGAGDWITLDGTVPSTAPPLTAVAADASTIIVGGDCVNAGAGGPGC